METLGYTWDRVHDEAEVLEHAVSDFMIERIDAILDHPTRDPHGDPIPDASGRISFPQTVPLTQCEPGERVVLERITDSDPKLLRYLQDHGFCCPARVYFLKRAPPFRRRLTCGFSRTPIIPMRLPLKTRIRALYP